MPLDHNSQYDTNRHGHGGQQSFLDNGPGLFSQGFFLQLGQMYARQLLQMAYYRCNGYCWFDCVLSGMVRSTLCMLRAIMLLHMLLLSEVLW